MTEPLLDLVIDALVDLVIDVERPTPDATVVRVELGGTVLWVRTDEEEEVVTVLGDVPVDVPEALVPVALELAARLSGNEPVGSYEVNPDNGAFTYKAGLDVRGDRLSVALLHRLVDRAIVATQRARGPLLQAVDGDGTTRGVPART